MSWIWIRAPATGSKRSKPKHPTGGRQISKRSHIEGGLPVTEPRMKALTSLQWTLGLVILIEAVLFVMPSAGHAFASTHMPQRCAPDSWVGQDSWRDSSSDSANG